MKWGAIKHAVEGERWEAAIGLLLDGKMLTAERAEQIEWFQYVIQCHRNLGRWREADAFAEKGLEKAPNSRMLRAEYALNAFEREDWTEAVRRLESLRQSQGSKVSGKTYARLVRAYRMSGQVAAARAVLDEGWRVHPGRVDLKREKDGLVKEFADAVTSGAGSTADGGALAASRRELEGQPENSALQEGLVDLLLEAGDLAESARLAEKALRRQSPAGPEAATWAAKVLKAHHLAGRAGCLEAFLAELPRIDHRRRPVAHEHGADIVAACGFYYSGSTAVFEFLQQDKETVAWPPNRGEFRLLSQQGGYFQLWEAVQEEGRFSEAPLRELALHMFGERPPALDGRFPGSFAHANSEFRKIAQSPHLEDWLHACTRSLRFLAAERDAGARREPESARQLVAEALCVLLQELVARIQPNAKRLLLDQAPHVANLPAAMVMPPTRFLIVSRDPRDQFVDGNNARQRQKRPPMNLDWFIKRYRRLERMVDEYEPKLEACGHRLLRLRFEDFVREEAEQARVAAFCGIPLSQMALKSRFDPAVSIRNIGLYKKDGDPGIREIEKALGAYLVS